ncbi:hypothetical protein F441_15120 [Phytophthora nicotianae CJ01A1]|uniref:Uncharacterized protein n=4 Tax=Phytophthora nicotianae TaxID=4792 RepID=W2YQ91_PHYNI|nr:hypothetical protein L915_14848 [Phytophthora nicotianae]ETO67818.1 hypothetical protein F444_15300 [Phytophthora nicotianae P1976]ETP08967.1 hypothetical protein F441_15120 [Phytophthora nicotianae CJ01A1]ETP37007.1 hypothetical protein F442_15144 [Phytophthora nicotianae P10297]ETL32691.1 hypothetical protein L916_14757 [Phytophthora nicotianae]
MPLCILCGGVPEPRLDRIHFDDETHSSLILANCNLGSKASSSLARYHRDIECMLSHDGNGSD